MLITMDTKLQAHGLLKMMTQKAEIFINLEESVDLGESMRVSFTMVSHQDGEESSV
jgi:hypothetical protein